MIIFRLICHYNMHCFIVASVLCFLNGCQGVNVGGLAGSIGDGVAAGMGNEKGKRPPPNLYVDNYAFSEKNVTFLKKSYTGTSIRINEILFTSYQPGKTTTSCRALGEEYTGPTIPNSKSFEEYIGSALLTEFKQAGLFSRKSKIKILGYIKEIDFSTFFNKRWTIEIVMFPNSTESFTIISEYPLSIDGFKGDIVCEGLAKAFLPTVQNLIYEIITHSEFVRFMNSQNEEN